MADNQSSENNNTKKGGKGESQVPAVPYQDLEFESFLDSLNNASLPLWKPIAKTLGIHPNTITRWSKHPRAIEAKKTGLNIALEGMAMAGLNNYQMWEKYLHLLGLANNIDEDESSDADNSLTESIKDLAETMKLNTQNGTTNKSTTTESSEPGSSEALS